MTALSPKDLKNFARKPASNFFTNTRNRVPLAPGSREIEGLVASRRYDGGIKG